MCVESDAMDPTQIKNRCLIIRFVYCEAKKNLRIVTTICRWMYWDGEAWQDAPDNFHVVAMDSNFDVFDPVQCCGVRIQRYRVSPIALTPCWVWVALHRLMIVLVAGPYKQAASHRRHQTAQGEIRES